MRFIEIIEGINMGQKALSRPPKKDYTIGLEIEVYTEHESEGDNDDAYERFADNWNGYDLYSIDDFINDNFEEGHIFEFFKDYEPKYGRPENIDETILKKMFNEDVYETITELAKFVNQHKSNIFDMGSELKKHSIYSVSDGSIARDIHTKLSSYGFTGNLANGYTFDEDMVINDENGNPEIITNIISDTDDLLMYFDIEIDDIHDRFDQDYYEHMSERMSDDFFTYSQSGNNTSGSIAYVKEFLDDNNFRRHEVVDDSTQGVSAEILTPILPVNDAINNMVRMFELFDENDIETSDACGLHINIGTWKDDYQNVDWFKFMVIFDAKRVLAQFGRTNNHFTTDKLDNIIRSLTYIDNALYKRSINEMNDAVFMVLDKFSAINFKKLIDFPNNRHIEIRAPGGEDYHKKIKPITDIIRRAIRALEIASDPNAYRKEYLKILYKLSPQKSKHPFMEYVNKLFPLGGIDYFSDIFEYADNENIPAEVLDKYFTSDLVRYMYTLDGKFTLGNISTIPLVIKNKELLDTKLFKHVMKAAKKHGGS